MLLAEYWPETRDGRGGANLCPPISLQTEARGREMGVVDVESEDVE